MKTYLSLGIHAQADEYALGILRGLYEFDQEADTEFKKSAEDDARMAFDELLHEWRRGRPDEFARNWMSKELAEYCSTWR
jgi:hypothetical protein